MRTSAAEPTNHSHFPALDGLRAVAFLMVFGQHYFQLPWGWAGVDIFFVLSGFLITGILFDTRDQPSRVRNFYIRRTLRIFPLYYGPMLLLVLLYPFFHWQWNWAWLLWPAYVGNFVRGYHTFTPGSALQMLADAQLRSRTFPGIHLNFGHFWSLCIEEQFYLLWPWIVFRIRDRRKLLCICLFFVVGCPLLRVLASHSLPQFMLNQEVLYRYTPFRIDALLLGGCIALIRRGPSRETLLTAARVGFALLSTVLLFWLALNPTARGNLTKYVYPAWDFTWGLSFIDAYAACLLVMSLESTSIAFRILNLRPLRWLGRISYGAYVFHEIFHPEFAHLFRNYSTKHATLLTAILALAFTLLAAWVSFRYFETPFIRLKERWTGRSSTVRNESVTIA